MLEVIVKTSLRTQIHLGRVGSCLFSTSCTVKSFVAWKLLVKPVGRPLSLPLAAMLCTRCHQLCPADTKRNSMNDGEMFQWKSPFSSNFFVITSYAVLFPKRSRLLKKNRPHMSRLQAIIPVVHKKVRCNRHIIKRFGFQLTPTSISLKYTYIYIYNICILKYWYNHELIWYTVIIFHMKIWYTHTFHYDKGR